MILKTIIALVLVTAAAISGFLWYNSRQSAVVEKDGGLSEKTTEVAEFRAMLGNLKTIKLDTSFFSDPVYKSFVDQNVLISKPVDYGRANPFLPVGAKPIAPKP